MEGYLGGLRARIGVFTADREAWSLSHAVKLRAMIGRCDGGMGRDTYSEGSSLSLTSTAITRPSRSRVFTYLSMSKGQPPSPSIPDVDVVKSSSDTVVGEAFSLVSGDECNKFGPSLTHG